MKLELRSIDDIKPDPRNARQHSEEQVDKLARMIGEFGWTNPILVDDAIRAGHGRLMAAQLIYSRGDRIRFPNGEEIPDRMVPCLDCTGWTDTQRRAYMLADNQLTIESSWDEAILRAELIELSTIPDFDLDLTGFETPDIEAILKGAEPGRQAKVGNLADEFLVAPFSVLNAREGWWQERKRAWLGLGIQSEVGRGGNLIKRSLPDRLAIIIPGHYRKAKAFIEKWRGQGLTDDQIEAKAIELHGKPKSQSARTFGQDLMRGEHVVGEEGGDESQTGTSIFDPVLCELSYLWFCPPKGRILDPFAGGSVRGIVAGRLGRDYLGIDLRPEQVDANRDQWARIKQRRDGKVEWLQGDSRDVLSVAREDGPPDGFDFVFSCPPYGDLEVYSDDPADLSTMDFGEFVSAYQSIIQRAVAKLQDDRFACFVVGDFRDKAGFYRDFVSATIRAFETAGARLYNEAIIVTATGSLAIRAGKQFRASRKLGKTHQNVLVFVKGDPVRAAQACGPVNVEAAMSALDSPEG